MTDKNTTIDECWTCGEPILKDTLYLEIQLMDNNKERGTLHRCHLSGKCGKLPGVNSDNINAILNPNN